MYIGKADNIIVTKHEIKIVPITRNLNDIEYVKTSIKKILRREEYKGKLLSIKGYLLNDKEEKVIVGDDNIKTVVCPYRNLSRKI